MSIENVHQPNQPFGFVVFIECVRENDVLAFETNSCLWCIENWLIQSRIQWNEWLVYTVQRSHTHKIHNEWIFSVVVWIALHCLRIANELMDIRWYRERKSCLKCYLYSFCQSRFFHFTSKTLNYNNNKIIIIRLENGWETSFW